MPPDLPAVGRLQHYNFPSLRAYTYKISRYAPEKFHKKFSIRAYRGLCGLFVAAGCRNSSHNDQQ